MTAKPRPDFIGERIRRLRKDRDLTQAELAGRIGIIQSDLCRMEKGEYKVGLDVLFRILGVFGMSISEFFNESANQAGTDEGELLRRFRALSEESKGEVLDFVRFKEQQDLMQRGS